MSLYYIGSEQAMDEGGKRLVKGINTRQLIERITYRDMFL